jgi:hypothetical protein
MRVYSIDWYENKERVLQQIIDEIKAIEQNRRRSKNDETKDVSTFSVKSLKAKAEEDISKNAGMVPYIEAEIVDYPGGKYYFYPEDPSHKETILDILTVEQPVCFNYLCKRLAKSFGFGHAGSNIQAAVTYATKGCYKVKSKITCDYYFINKETADNYKSYRGKSPRSIAEIPQIEIENAVIEVVKEEFALPQDKIPTLAAKKLGFASAASKIREAINSTILILIDQNRINAKDSFITLVDSI